ncbi:MAG: hypothetical protein H6R02_465 [Burkholderiaceae bacterium]|jgi:two-component system CheB/CheR fusion protein|nr:hypothetical protein [Burkholderiaceae bacterium]
MVENPLRPDATGADLAVSLRVFLVENHEDTRTLLCMLLESLGHRVLAAETMKEALRTLPLFDCDVLISDIGLPDGDGWELMQRLRLKHPIYAVAISGFGMSTDCARSRSVGYRHHLVKPYGIEQLPAILREAANECARTAAPRPTSRER